MRNMEGLGTGLICLIAGNFESKPCTKMFLYCFRDSDHKLLIFLQKSMPFVGLVIFVVLLRKPRKLFPLLLALVPHLGTQPLHKAAFSLVVH